MANDTLQKLMVAEAKRQKKIIDEGCKKYFKIPAIVIRSKFLSRLWQKRYKLEIKFYHRTGVCEFWKAGTKVGETKI